MQTGAFISGWGHLIVIGVAALSGPIFQDEAENSISVSEISVVSLSEFDILQKKFSKDENYSNSLIDIKKEEDQLEELDENTSNKDDDQIIDKEKLASEIIKTSTPSIDSPELPEIVNSTPSGFETSVSIVGEEVALNLDVSEASRLQSPEDNFDIEVDIVSLPVPINDLDLGDTIDQTDSNEVSDITEKIIENNVAPVETITQPLIDAITAELTSAPILSVRPKGRSLDDATLVSNPAEEVANNQNILLANEELVLSARNAPSGPPLTRQEKDSLRISVSRCWNKNSLSRDAMGVTITVLFNMLETGYPENESIKMISSTGGSPSAVKIAYKSARRAILRCGNRGFDLPEQKYSQWKTIEMVFDPIKMRIK